MFDQELYKLKDMFGNGEDLSSEELEDFESIIDFRRRQDVLKKESGYRHQRLMLESQYMTTNCLNLRFVFGFCCFSFNVSRVNRNVYKLHAL
jgi:hypothetical protein